MCLDTTRSPVASFRHRWTATAARSEPCHTDSAFDEPCGALMQKKLDLFADAAIALVALLIGFTLIRQQIDRSHAAKALAASNALQTQVRPGTPLAPIAG